MVLSLPSCLLKVCWMEPLTVRYCCGQNECSVMNGFLCIGPSACGCPVIYPLYLSYILRTNSYLCDFMLAESWCMLRALTSVMSSHFLVFSHIFSRLLIVLVNGLIKKLNFFWWIWHKTYMILVREQFNLTWKFETHVPSEVFICLSWVD
jgi:hypothetical protein